MTPDAWVGEPKTSLKRDKNEADEGCNGAGPTRRSPKRRRAYPVTPEAAASEPGGPEASMSIPAKT